MSKCIYREVTLNSNKPEDDDTASDEHIIPWAIGGSDGFIIRDASKVANNDLGSEVDARFVNMLPLAIMRHRLQLKSQNGNIAPIIWRGESPDGIGATVTIEAGGNLNVDVKLAVTKPEKGQQGPIVVSGPPEKVEPILAGLLKGIRRRNEIIYSEDGKILETLDDFSEISNSFMVDQVHLRVEYFNKEIWVRGMLKIALAAGHKILESDWTFGPSAANIRQIVMNPRKDWPKALPRGFIAGELNRSLRLALGKNATVRDQNMHTVAVLPAGESGAGIIAISLFGGGGVPEAVIGIGKLPGAIVDALNSDAFHETIMGYRVDPRSRTTTPIKYGEIDRRIATMGPTNRKSMRVYQDRSLR